MKRPISFAIDVVRFCYVLALVMIISALDGWPEDDHTVDDHWY